MDSKQKAAAFVRRGLAGLCAGLLFSSLTFAQAPLPDAAAQDAQELLRQQQRERALREQQPSQPDVRLESEEPQPFESLATLDESPCFRIDQIILEGDEAQYFDWALRAADPKDDPATGRCLGTRGINIVMGRIQNAIIAKGYVTTRILAPQQGLTQGRLRLTVVPGRIREIDFGEAGQRLPTYRNAITAEPGALLNLRAIEQSLENLQRVPTVDAGIQIVPAAGSDAKPGESDLLIGWRQRSRVRVSATLDDSGSKATGKNQAGVTLSIDNPFQIHDLFYINAGHDVLNDSGRGTWSAMAHYSVPMKNWLFALTASHYDYQQRVIGASQDYVYSGASDNADVRISRLLHRNAYGKTGAYARLWWRRSNNFIDDVEVQVQRRRTAGAELGFTHRHFIGAATLDASASYRQGLGALGALPAPEELFGEGTSRMRLINADMQFARPFRLGNRTLRYLASARGQWNFTPLTPQDRLAIGGRYTVRGFDGEAVLMGERGALLRNEVAFAFARGQELYLGGDYGQIGGASSTVQVGSRMAGAVVGWRGVIKGFNWDLFAGKPLYKPANFPTEQTTLGFTVGWSH